MTSVASRFKTKELSVGTWPDFVKLFSQGHGWDFCACMLFQRGHHLPRSKYPSRSDMQVRNLEEKRRLVEQGLAHGILVYAEGQPVGWCQYGPVEELPIPGYSRKNSKYPTGFLIALNDAGRAFKRPAAEEAQWRITCYVTNNDLGQRRKGVATAAFQAALESIARKGGGLVEALMPGAWAPKWAAKNQSVQLIRVEGKR
jgi:hypothetical protein